MAHGSSPIAIGVPRNNSTSPRTSNLTYALQAKAAADLRPSPGTNFDSNPHRSSTSGRHDSISMSGLTPQYGSGAVPISVNNSGRNQPRRESLAGSMMGGMSWGGVSMNSWIRDDIIMQGSSPFANGFQSPSFHSSSYLPKLEANFMKDFTCCNLILPSLHDLLQHFEEAHAQQIAPMNGQYPLAGGISDGMNGLPRTGVSTQQQNQQNISSGVNQQQAANRLPTNTQMQSMQAPQMGNNPQSNMHSQPSQDMEAVEDMEMDDVPGDYSSGVTGYAIPETQPYGQRSQYGQTNTTRVPPLDLNTMNINNPLQSFQGIRQSQPSTPVSSGRQGALFGNNPTVSSVNTPTLSAHPLQHQFRNTPDSSTPGTPAELDPDFVGNLGGMTMDGQGFMMSQPQANSGFGFQNGNDLLDFCIDEPAKRLFSPNGAFASNQGQSRLGNAQYGANSEIARRIREQQCKVGLSDTVNVPNGEEPKPFRCPVIGCEKAYKNQNGLKYHKSHGHNNQQLHENADGTFSIVDPTTLSPYPGTMGMEKEKPFKCDVCGKRYKNLNGLKYHKTHSPPCNPELKLNPAIPINTSNMSANVAGAGLTGIGEEL